MTVIRPEVTPLTAPYWENAQRGVVVLQYCTPGGHTWHPPQPSCPECGTTEWTWVPSAGHGTLYSYTTVRHAAHPAVVDRLPYIVCLVALDEGPLILCNLLQAADEPCVIGSEVEIVLGPSLAGFELPQARLRVGLSGQERLSTDG
jgi:uncharacterized protein